MDCGQGDRGCSRSECTGMQGKSCLHPTCILPGRESVQKPPRIDKSQKLSAIQGFVVKGSVCSQEHAKARGRDSPLQKAAAIHEFVSPGSCVRGRMDTQHVLQQALYWVVQGRCVAGRSHEGFLLLALLDSILYSGSEYCSVCRTLPGG